MLDGPFAGVSGCATQKVFPKRGIDGVGGRVCVWVAQV